LERKPRWAKRKKRVTGFPGRKKRERDPGGGRTGAGRPRGRARRERNRSTRGTLKDRTKEQKGCPKVTRRGFGGGKTSKKRCGEKEKRKGTPRKRGRFAKGGKTDEDSGRERKDLTHTKKRKIARSSM